MKRMLLIGAVALAGICDAEVERFDALREISPMAVKPEGWMKEYLVRQQSGMTGRPETQGFPMDTKLWEGVIDASRLKNPNSWWPYEQTAYYLDGMLRLGYLLDDAALIERFQKNIDWVIANPTEKGLVGTSFYKNPSHWPNGVFFKAVIPYYMDTGDARVREAYHKHYATTTAEDIGIGFRNVTNVEGLLKVYEWTGDAALLKKAEEAYRLHNENPNLPDDFPLSVFESDAKFVTHGVTYSEMLKLPVILYLYTGNPRYLGAAEKAMRVLERDHMGPSGVPSSTEYLTGKDPVQGHETCVASDFFWALGYYLMATGNAKYADMLEKIAFNAGPGAVSKDFRSLQYLSSDNQFVCTGKSNHNKFHHGGRWMQYSPHHGPACCPGNVHRMMPIYANRMWMTGKDGAVTAALYGPSVLTVKPGVVIEERTEYPFGDEITFVFKMAAPAEFPFSFRIPGWCDAPALTINGKPYEGALKTGSFVTISRSFKEGDALRLKLPMPVKLNRFQQALSLERGPILYSYAIPEKSQTDKNETKFSDFPALLLTPTAPWNYALDLDESNFRDRVKVLPRETAAYPFDLRGGGMPALEVPVRKIDGWKLNKGRTPLMPVVYKPIGETETLRLVPYGATRLRLTHFPKCIARTELPTAKWELSPAYPYDRAKSLDAQPYAPESAGFNGWTAITPDQTALVDMNTLFKEKQDSLAYARAVIPCGKPGSAFLAVNAKDAATIWLNGKVVHTIQPPCDVEFQSPDWVPVELKTGDNTVLVKIGRFGKLPQYPDGWGVRIRCVR